MKKKSVKFNVIDIIVLLVSALVLIIVVGSFFKSGDTVYNDKNMSKIEIIIETSAIKSDYLVDSLKIGEPIAECQKSEIIGRISDYSVIEIQKDTKTNISGSGLCKLRLKIIANAEKQNNRYFINDEQILINKDTEFSVPNLYFKGKYISISEINSELSQQTNNNQHKNGGSND